MGTNVYTIVQILPKTYLYIYLASFSIPPGFENAYATSNDSHEISRGSTCLVAGGNVINVHALINHGENIVASSPHIKHLHKSDYASEVRRHFRSLV